MKKIILTLAVAGMATGVQAQHAYEVAGTTAPEVKQVYMMKMEDRRATPDTINVVNGRFSLKGENKDVRFVYVVTDKDPYRFVPVMLSGKTNVDMSNLTFSGSEEATRLSSWWARVRVIEDKIAVLSNEMQDAQKQYEEQGKGQLPDSIVAKFYKRYYAHSAEQSEIARQCALENKDYYFPAVLLAGAGMKNEDWIALADAKARCMETPLLHRYVASIEGWRRQAVGVAFTDFEMADTTGTMRRLSDFVGNGKYVLVDFWASWCGPCRQEMPAVKALYEKYHAKGFDIVGVSFDNKRDAWLKSINSLGLPWHHISDLKGWQCAAGSIYGINSIPATLLIGPDGKIVAAGLRAEALGKKLAEIFGE